MFGGENVLLCASRAVIAGLLLFSGPAAVAAEPEGELAHRLEAVVRVIPRSRPMRAPPRISAPSATAQAW